MLLWKRLRVALLAWAVGEILLFALVAHFAGFGPTVLTLLATSLLGLYLLKRLGIAAQGKLRAAFAGRGGRAGAADGALQALGAVALVIPGFLSDLVGAALLIAPVRAAVAARFGSLINLKTGSRRTGEPLVDLAPGEWHRSDPGPPPTLERHS